MKHCLIAAAAVVAAASAFAADLLPLETGNNWTYRNSKTGQTFTVRVGVPVMTQDRVYYSLSGYARTTVLVRVDESGNNLVYMDEEQGRERVLTSFIPFGGGWWEAPVRSCEQEGQTLDKRGVFDGAAGPIHDVLEVRYRSYCPDEGIETEQFAENVGMVRRVVGSIAGPRRFDLVYARVGRSIIDALPHGRFTVSAEVTAGSRFIPVRLRIQTDPSLPLKLRFPSGQEYELYMTDQAGTVVWTWSADKSFVQSEHERDIAGEWTAVVEMPRPSGVGPMPGVYTIHAFMTTTEASPRFAGAFPITLTPLGEE